eukprot:7193989-Pyramimonas_sp.AAC.1
MGHLQQRARLTLILAGPGKQVQAGIPNQENNAYFKLLIEANHRPKKKHQIKDPRGTSQDIGDHMEPVISVGKHAMHMVAALPDQPPHYGSVHNEKRIIEAGPPCLTPRSM